mmetsp:Transcript_29935/g.95578  ORF Transcript_29935/g.95578 Transcript_29935/m.95578 type:complete len:87 (-) Transcript_29935:107-367(-)
MGKKEKGGGGGAVSPDSGSSDAGAKLFKAKCATCHTANDGGPNKQGPNLWGVMGRQETEPSGHQRLQRHGQERKGRRRRRSLARQR